MGVALADPARLFAWLSLGQFEPASDDGVRATEVVGTISDLVRGEARRDWDGATVPPDVAAIVLMVSARVFGNADGKTSITIEEVTRRWENGDLFSDSQLATIRSHRPNQSSGLGAVEFTRGLIAQPIRTPVEGGAPMRLYDGRGY